MIPVILAGSTISMVGVIDRVGFDLMLIMRPTSCNFVRPS